jgi:hypothetical protein
MTVKEKIQSVLYDFKIDAEKAILNGEFEKVEEDKYTITIKVLDEVVDVWTVEGQETHLYGLSLGEYEEKILFNDKSGRLKNPEECRKMLVGEKQC